MKRSEIRTALIALVPHMNHSESMLGTCRIMERYVLGPDLNNEPSTDALHQLRLGLLKRTYSPLKSAVESVGWAGELEAYATEPDPEPKPAPKVEPVQEKAAEKKARKL